jgi:hypothetical protein
LSSAGYRVHEIPRSFVACASEIDPDREFGAPAGRDEPAQPAFELLDPGHPRKRNDPGEPTPLGVSQFPREDLPSASK